MQNFINLLSQNTTIKVFIICILFDVFLGCIRAIKEHDWNSTVGINGVLRKIGMIGSVFFLFATDLFINIDLLFMIPDELLTYVGITKVGVCDFFSILFILYEITSILKNMVLCGLPVPAFLKTKIESLLNTMTTELDGKGGVENENG